MSANTHWNISEKHFQINYTRQRNCLRWHGGGYSFKRCPFSFQDMAFCLLKDGLLHYERIAIANFSEVSENRK